MSRTAPAAPPRPRDARGPDRPSSQSVDGSTALRVVVCDSEASTRFALRRLITQELSCSIVECSSSDELGRALATNAVDLLLLDIEMPTIDGVDLLREIRASSELRTLPVILLSRERRRETVVKLADLGIDGYLLKPLRRDTLSSTLERLRPRLVARPTPAAATVPLVAASSRAAVALIVDGEPAFRQFFARASGLPGAVAQAASGTQALAVYQQAPCPIVFIGGGLGILAPEMLAARLRVLAAGRTLKIVRIHPAGGRASSRASTGAAGNPFDRALARTFDPARLRAELAALTEVGSEEADVAAERGAALPPAARSAAREARPGAQAVEASPATGVIESVAAAPTLDSAPLCAEALRVVASASAQVFSLLVDAEIERRDSIEIGEPAIGATVDLSIEGKGVLVLGVRASAASMAQIAAQMLGKDAADVNTDDVTSAVHELARSIGGHTLVDLAGDAAAGDASEPRTGPVPDGAGGGRGEPDARVSAFFAVPLIEASVVVSVDLYAAR